MTRYEICGIFVDDATLDDAVQRIDRMLRSTRPHAVYYANPETLARTSRDEAFRATMRTADLVFPDGIGLKIFGRIVGAPFHERIAGIDLLFRVCERAAYIEKSVFLIGARNNVAARASLLLGKRFPSLHILGALDGYDGAEKWDRDSAIENADIVFVGMGSPKQEEWIRDNMHKLPQVKCMVAVGGAFDMITGDTPRAPVWMRTWGLEWVWRFCIQPRRWRRIMNAIIVFPIKAIVWHMKKKRTQ